MTKIVTTINGIHGNIKIAIVQKDNDRVMELKWCLFDDTDQMGFVTSFSDVPFMITDCAAEQFIRMILGNLVLSLELKPGDLTIINHLGESLPDVQFLPPTFEGNEADIIAFVNAQDTLCKIYTIYEKSGILNSDLLQMAEGEGVLDDFLSLIQIRASGKFLTIKKPN